MKLRSVFLLLMPVALSGCHPISHFYEECHVTSDCTTEAQGCYTVINPANGIQAGFCSAECQTDANCPLDYAGVQGACYVVDGSPVPLCFHRCGFDSDCPPGFGCFDASANDRVCSPY